ncbi:unnamed protein product [Sympodiomycopsis kandeliae]
MPNLVRAAWLQSMLIHRYTTDKQGRALYEAACEVAKCPFDSSQFDDFVHDASTAVSSFGLEVRRMPDPWTGRGMIALVNTKGDEIAQMATNYSPSEILLLKKLIEMIFTSKHDSFSTSSTEILNVAKRLKPTLTQSSAERFIDTLIHHGWIHKSRQGYLSLSSRALLELQTYLKEQYPDEILTCHECQHIVTRGLSCGSCDGVKIHTQCEVFIPGNGNQKKCPQCKVAWEPARIGEENLKGANSSRRRQRARSHEEEEEESDPNESEGNDDDEEQVNQLSQDTEVEDDNAQEDEDEDDQPNTSIRGKRGRRAVTSTTEEDNDEPEEDQDEEEEEIRGSSRRRNGASIVKRRRPS